MITERCLNSIVVKPLVNTVNNNIDISKIRGGSVISTVYGVTFLCAKRASGKTATLSEILLRTTDKKTEFFIFCPTYKVDRSWITLIDKLISRGNEVNLFDSIMDGKINILNDIVLELSTPSDPIIQIEPEKQGVSLNFGVKAVVVRKAKEVKLSPKYCFVFDDISNELKNTGLVSLLKKSRHFKASVYISSQYIHDLPPQSIKQLDYFLCFRSFSKDKLEHIYKLLDLSIGLETFLLIYDFCFDNLKEKYTFLYIDVRNQKFRKNFNKEIVIS